MQQNSGETDPRPKNGRCPDIGDPPCISVGAVSTIRSMNGTTQRINKGGRPRKLSETSIRRSERLIQSRAERTAVGVRNRFCREGISNVSFNFDLVEPLLRVPGGRGGGKLSPRHTLTLPCALDHRSPLIFFFFYYNCVSLCIFTVFHFFSIIEGRAVVIQPPQYILSRVISFIKHFLTTMFNMRKCNPFLEILYILRFT